jgi:hypothetical protein
LLIHASPQAESFVLSHELSVLRHFPHKPSFSFPIHSNDGNNVFVLTGVSCAQFLPSVNGQASVDFLQVPAPDVPGPKVRVLEV